MNFDLRTLFVITVLIYLVVGVSLLAMWRLRRTEHAFAYWGCANLSISLGSALLSLRDQIPDELSIVVANALLTTGIGLLWIGKRRFNGQALHWPVIWLAPAAILLLFGFFPPVAESTAARTRVVYGIVLAFSVLSVVDTWRAQQREWLGMRRVALCVSIAVCVIMALGIIGVSDANLPSDFLAPHPSRFFTNLAVFVAVLIWDISLLLMANERLENRLADIARIDMLTGALNRAGFHTLAEQRIDQCIREQRPASVLLMDLDHFKRVNDTHGHEAGDHLLRRFVEVAQQMIRPGDLLSRHGGEEFCLLMPGADLTAAQAVAERIRAGFERVEVRVGDAVFGVTVSIGAAQIELPGEPLDAALARADQALYEAKRLGRNRVEALSRESRQLH